VEVPRRGGKYALIDQIFSNPRDASIAQIDEAIKDVYDNFPREKPARLLGWPHHHNVVPPGVERDAILVILERIRYVKYHTGQLMRVVHMNEYLDQAGLPEGVCGIIADYVIEDPGLKPAKFAVPDIVDDREPDIDADGYGEPIDEDPALIYGPPSGDIFKFVTREDVIPHGGSHGPSA
jgi:hypothetical protein